MDWILGHLQVVVAVAAAIAYWFNQQKSGARGDDDEPAPGAAPLEQVRADGMDDERTRRVQEEIRRKIAERRAGGLPPASDPLPSRQPVAPPVIAPRPVAREMPGGLRERLEARLAEARAKAEAAIQARERQQQEERRQQEAELLAAQRRTEAAVARDVTISAAPAPAVAPTGSKAWSGELRDPRSLRRAVILREVLGPPVGLR